jgi:hypothetical protein
MASTWNSWPGSCGATNALSEREASRTRSRASALGRLRAEVATAKRSDPDAVDVARRIDPAANRVHMDTGVGDVDTGAERAALDAAAEHGPAEDAHWRAVARDAPTTSVERCQRVACSRRTETATSTTRRPRATARPSVAAVRVMSRLGGSACTIGFATDARPGINRLDPDDRRRLYRLGHRSVGQDDAHRPRGRVNRSPARLRQCP